MAASGEISMTVDTPRPASQSPSATRSWWNVVNVATC